MMRQIKTDTLNSDTTFPHDKTEKKERNFEHINWGWMSIVL